VELAIVLIDARLCDYKAALLLWRQQHVPTSILRFCRVLQNIALARILLKRSGAALQRQGVATVALVIVPHFPAAPTSAETAGMKPVEINTALKTVAAHLRGAAGERGFVVWPLPSAVQYEKVLKKLLLGFL
jgi:hypothetical protein